MSLRIKHLNADTSWLLIFSPPCAGKNLNGSFPGTYTILVDPWLSGPSKVFSSRFASTSHTVPACVSSLRELPEPDLVIISQDKSDHCNEGTLKQLSPTIEAPIVCPPAAAKKIRSWKHFDPENIHALKKFDSQKPDTLFTIDIPPFSPTGLPGEVTISLITSKVDVTGLHNAIGITYKPPSSVLSTYTGSCLSLPITPPTTPPESPDASPLSGSVMLRPSARNNRERTLSVIYSPHGLPWSSIKPYATSHLLAEAALPLTALFHCFDRASNPWYLGGNVSSGFPNGVEIAEALCAKTWISAHDEEKEQRGFSTKALKLEKYSLNDIKQKLDMSTDLSKTPKSRCNTDVVEIGVGQDFFIPGK